MSDGPTCPRCATTGARVLARSPVPDVWTVHGCDHCHFHWRSTEPPTVSDPRHYPARFRVGDDDLAAASAVPPVPERRA